MFVRTVLNSLWRYVFGKMATTRMRLKKVLFLMAVVYGIAVFAFTISLPREWNSFAQQTFIPAEFPVTLARAKKAYSSLDPTYVTGEQLPGSQNPKPVSVTSLPVMSTVCPMRVTHRDTKNNISAQTYFQPCPQPVTDIVSSFLIQPSANFCSGALDILFLVPSSPIRRNYRDAIRETWGSGRWPHINHSIQMAVLFLLAKPTGAAHCDVSWAVVKEAAQHGDMLMVDAEDGYRQMTVKMLAGLQWISRRCPRLGYVSRVDEDHFLHVPCYFHYVHSWYQQSAQRDITLMGKVLCSLTSVVHRTNLSKHFVQFSDYPFDYFPTYLGGATYVMTAKLLPRLVNVSRYVRSFTVDDSYITGVLARTLKLLLVNLPRLIVEGSTERFLAQSGISKHNGNSETTRSIWRKLGEQSYGKQYMDKCVHTQIRSLKSCGKMCSTKGDMWVD